MHFCGCDHLTQSVLHSELVDPAAHPPYCGYALLSCAKIIDLKTILNTLIVAAVFVSSYKIQHDFSFNSNFISIKYFYTLNVINS